MTPEQQRIAIAEACGWHVSNLSINGRPEVVWVLYDPSGKEVAFGRDVRPKDLPSYAAVFSCDYLPDYLNDLNAMHEAEKTLYGMQCHYYALRLCNPLSVPFTGVHATAAQRAEAFLRTIEKWVEG